MKSSVLMTLSVAAGLLMAADALADSASDGQLPHWYVGLDGGVDFLKDVDLRGEKTGKVTSDTGWDGGISLGYRPYFGGVLNGFRFELEEAYHENGLNGGVIGGVHTAVGGHTDALASMGNVFYDVRTGTQWTPYLGAGAGVARVGMTTNNVLGNTDNRDDKMAYQFMAGLAYAPTTIPLTEWTLGYRYFAVRDPEFTTSTSQLKLNDYGSNDVELGARFDF